MRILFINRLAGTLLGGGENFILQWMPALMERGHSVELLTGRPIRGEGVSLPSPLTAHRVRTPYLRYFGLKHRLPRPLPGLFVLLDFWLFRWAVFFRLKRLLSSSHFDLIVVTGFPSFAQTLERRFKIPCVVRMPGPPLKMDHDPLKSISGVVANGDAYRQLLPLKLSRLANIPPGIDPRYFHTISSEERHRLRQSHGLDSFVVYLFVGRLVPIKNLPFLLDSFAALIERQPNSRLILVGEGEERAELQSRLRTHRLESLVQLVPPQYKNDLRDYYRLADVFVLTSHYDNFPQVVNEAMASGLPVVATAVGGVPLQVTNETTGLLIPPGDHLGFCDALHRLGTDEQLRHTMGEAGRRSVQGHDWAHAAIAFETFAAPLLTRCQS